MVRGGRALPLPASKKTRALLGYLVATGTPHLRERLCELLWDGPDDPRAALRWSLSKLRPLVDEPHLVADRERIGFVGDGVDVDLHALRGALGDDATTDELRRAAERASGELLDGLDLPDCFRYHAWCTAEREAVRGERIKLFTALAARLGERGARRGAQVGARAAGGGSAVGRGARGGGALSRRARTHARRGRALRRRAPRCSPPSSARGRFRS